MDVLKIGPLMIRGRAVLAPMSGISDWPFRRLAARFGAPLVVSEMVAAGRLVAREALRQLGYRCQEASVLLSQEDIDGIVAAFRKQLVEWAPARP